MSEMAPTHFAFLVPKSLYVVKLTNECQRDTQVELHFNVFSAFATRESEWT